MKDKDSELKIEETEAPHGVIKYMTCFLLLQNKKSESQGGKRYDGTMMCRTACKTQRQNHIMCHLGRV